MSGATESIDGTRKKWKHGATITPDGTLRFTSVSALELAVLCLRRWTYAYKWKLKDPQTEAQLRGESMHAEVARYERTGQKPTSSQVLVGLGARMIPAPGPDLLVEYDMVPDLADGSSGLAYAILRAGDLPVTGAIDLIHARPENPGVQDIHDVRDPAGTLKIIDWKFTGKLDHAKAGHELVDTLQMAGYAKFGFELAPYLGLNIDRVRISHGYMPAKGTPRMPTALVTREQVEKTWKRADRIAVSMRDAAKENDPDRIDADVRACRAYNRDCPARGVCRAAMHNSLTAFVGVTRADRVLQAMKLPLIDSSGDHCNMATPGTSFQPNSIFAALKERQNAQGAPGALAPPPLLQQPQPQQFAAPQVGHSVAPPPQQFAAPSSPLPPPAQVAAPSAMTPTVHQPVPQPSQADIEAEMARLAAVAGAAQQAAALTQVAQDPRSLLSQMESYGACYGIGIPTWSGAAATLVASIKNFALQPGAPVAGWGELAAYQITDPAQWPQVVEEMRNMYAQRAAQAVGQAPSAPQAPSLLPPNTPVSGPPIAQAPAAPPTTAQQATVPPPPPALDEGKKRGGRKAAAAPAPETTTTTGATPASTSVPQVAAASGTAAINVYIDCMVTGMQLKPLRPLVEHIVNQMYKDAGATDFRLVAKESPYAFNGWQGILASGLFAATDNGDLPPGNYVFDSGGPISGVVIETMHQLVARTGGIVVRGAR